MGTETERKFLVKNDAWRAAVKDSRRLVQGYVAIDGQTIVRVRLDGERAWLTLKGPQDGVTRPEFEYEIPKPDAEALMGLCLGRVVEKVRHRVPVGAHLWEIDEFRGANDGLVVAEVELGQPEEAFNRPGWLGDEVSEDARFFNASLSLRPFATWEVRGS